MGNNPKIKVYSTAFDVFMDAAAGLALLGFWGIVLLHYPDLPPIVPIHFNALGQADRYDSRSMVLVLPVVATVLSAGIAYLEKYPHLLNYPVQITQHNARQQYSLALRLLRSARLFIVLLLAYIFYQTYRVALGYQQGLGIWFLAAVLGLFTMLLGLYVYSSWQMK